MMTVGVSGWQVDKVQGLCCVQVCVYPNCSHGGRLPLLFLWHGRHCRGVNKDLLLLLSGSHEVTGPKLTPRRLAHVCVGGGGGGGGGSTRV